MLLPTQLSCRFLQVTVEIIISIKWRDFYGGDTVFIVCMSVCLCPADCFRHSGHLNANDSKTVKLQTSNLAAMWRSIRSWLRSLGFVHVFLIQESHIFKWADLKICSTTPHQIFRVCTGHKGGHNDTVLGEFDEGILRGGGGKKNFWPPISPPLGVRERWNFYTWRRYIGPMSGQNIGP